MNLKYQLKHQIKKMTVALLLFGIMVARAPLHAQPDYSITIRMLDSKTGRPITTSEFQVWIDHASGTNGSWVRPDSDGVGEMALPRSASVISVHAQYGTAMWSYVNCDSVKDRGPYFDHWYTISDILTSGIVAPNRCSKQKVIAKPGEFIFFRTAYAPLGKNPGIVDAGRSQAPFLISGVLPLPIPLPRGSGEHSARAEEKPFRDHSSSTTIRRVAPAEQWNISIWNPLT